jgi:recombination protein RecT
MIEQQDANGNGTKRQVAVQTPIAAVRQQLSSMGAQFRAALPNHISVDRFSRVVMTAVQNNPELLECDQRSLWNAAMKAAQDGLLPDGREGAITVRKDWKKGTKLALWQPMITGIRKKARNSGEIATWDAHVVFANDIFEYELGDDPSVRHKPALTNRGPIIAAYSVCTLKSGEKTREIMSIEQIHEIRDRYSDGWKAFKAGYIKSTPWSTSEEEMCRKTVARRHSKVLPMSSDLDILMRRDDQRQEDDDVAVPRIATTSAERLKVDLDALARSGDSDDHPHDPDTGEIIHRTLPPRPGDGSEIGGRYVPDEIISGEMAAKAQAAADALNAERLAENARMNRGNSDDNSESSESSPPLDIGTQRLLGDARLKAKDGVGVFTRWHKVLSKDQTTRLAPYLEQLKAEAIAADEARP